MVAILTSRGMEPMEMIHEIPTDEIEPHPANRDEFDEQKTSDMEDSLRANGQLTPAMLRPLPNGKKQLIAGERRWRGCVAVGIPTLRAVIRNYSDEQALEILIWENLERENLSELQEARLYQALMDMKDVEGRNVYTLERIAEKRFGDVRKLSRVAQILKLNALPEVMKKALKAGMIKTRHAFMVARIAEPNMREQAAKEVLNDPFGSGPMTVERAQRHISDNFQVSVKGAKFDKESSTILSEATKLKLGFTGAHGEKNDSSCERCPWLARNNPAFEGDLAVKSKAGKSQPGIDPHTCTFTGCHQAKMEALWMLSAVPFAKEHGVPEAQIRLLKDGGSGYADYSQGRLFLTAKINDTRVLVDAKIEAWQLSLKAEEMPAKVPTWREVMKGAEVPMEVIAGPKGEPILIADKALAIMAGKAVMPGLFAGVKSAIQRKDMSPDERAAEEAAEKEAAERKKRETAISAGTRAAAVREMLEKIRAKGAGVGLLQSLIRATMENTNSPEQLMEWWFGKKVSEWDDLSHEELAEQWMEGLGVNDLWALLTLLTVGDDVVYSWHSAAGCRDFDAICEEYGVERQAVQKRVTKEYDTAAKVAAAAAAAKVKPKLKSKGVDKDEGRETALINEEVAITEILKKGDQERAEMPSHGLSRAGGSPLIECVIKEADDAASVHEQLKNLEVPVMLKNAHGVFEKPSRLTCQISSKVRFEVMLATDGAGHWFEAVEYDCGTRSGGGLPKDGHVFQIRECAVAEAVRSLVSTFKTKAEPKVEADAVKARAFLNELKKLVERDEKAAGEAWHAVNNPQDRIDEIDDFTDSELEACREWRKNNPGAGAGMMADALSLTMDEAYAIIDKLVDEKHDGIAAEKQAKEELEFDAQVKRIAEGKAKPSDFIGVKPDPEKKADEYKKWNAQRMKLKRAAAKLQEAA